MKGSLLLLLFAPLHSFAQFGGGYTGPTMQQNMQSRQDFNRMSNQRTVDFNRQMQDRQFRRLENNRAAPGMQPLTAAERVEAQAKQQKAELEANEQLARLAQEQQRKRLEHPAKNPQQAANQQKADDRQLALLALKNYRDVFLPEQFDNALQARDLSPKADHSLQALNKTLADDAWWSKQQGPQLTEKIKAYGDTLTSLTAGLLGFDLASPPPTPAQLSSSRLDDMLAKGTLNPTTAAQLVQEVAMAEKLISGGGLAKAVVDFQALSASSASNPELQSNPKKLRKEIKASLNRVNAEMHSYQTRVYSLSRLPAAQKAMVKATSTYLAKYGS